MYWKYNHEQTSFYLYLLNPFNNDRVFTHKDNTVVVAVVKSLLYVSFCVYVREYNITYNILYSNPLGINEVGCFFSWVHLTLGCILFLNGTENVNQALCFFNRQQILKVKLIRGENGDINIFLLHHKSRKIVSCLWSIILIMFNFFIQSRMVTFHSNKRDQEFPTPETFHFYSSGKFGR